MHTPSLAYVLGKSPVGFDLLFVVCVADSVGNDFLLYQTVTVHSVTSNTLWHKNKAA